MRRFLISALFASALALPAMAADAPSMCYTPIVAAGYTEHDFIPAQRDELHMFLGVCSASGDPKKAQACADSLVRTLHGGGSDYTNADSAVMDMVNFGAKYDLFDNLKTVVAYRDTNCSS